MLVNPICMFLFISTCSFESLAPTASVKEARCSVSWAQSSVFILVWLGSASAAGRQEGGLWSSGWGVSAGLCPHRTEKCRTQTENRAFKHWAPLFVWTGPHFKVCSNTRPLFCLGRQSQERSANKSSSVTTSCGFNTALVLLGQVLILYSSLLFCFL